MSQKNILRYCPFKDQNEGWSSEKESQIKLSYFLCTHVYVSAGAKVLDVGVEVVLYMCDSGASFLCEHKTPIGSLQYIHHPPLKKGLSQEMGEVGLSWLIIKVDIGLLLLSVAPGKGAAL
jgi:hypothetical protein